MTKLILKREETMKRKKVLSKNGKIKDNKTRMKENIILEREQ